MKNETPPRNQPETNLPCLLDWEKLAQNDPERSFYQLQDAMHKILEMMVLRDKTSGYPDHIMKQTAWRNDGLDHCRAMANLIIQRIETFNKTPDVTKKLCKDHALALFA